MKAITSLRSCLLLIILMAGCTKNSSPTVIPASITPLPSSTPTKEEPHRSVVLISWDGGGANIVYPLIKQGHLPHFAEVLEKGIHAEYALSVDPPLTAAAQTSIASGSYPNRHGIVSNSFHNPNDSFYWYRVGYNELMDQAEPVWETASKAGFTSACLFFVGCSPAHPGQTADYTLGYGIRDAYSKQMTVQLDAPSGEWAGEAPQSYSPPLEGSFTIREVARIWLWVTDSSDDGDVNYDTVTLNLHQAFDENANTLRIGEWGQLVLIRNKMSGADFLIQEIDSEEGPRFVKLFYSGVYHNAASPREFLEEINRKFGYFPAGADYYAVDHGWITPEENLYLLRRATEWMAEVTAWVYTTYQPDLLFTWQDGFDTAGHSYWLTQSNQYAYSSENAERFADLYLQAVGAADKALEIMLEAFDLDQTTLLMVADHGMAPIHTIVYVNTILEQAGLLTLDNRDYVVVSESKAFAVVSGGAANIYINLKGHEKNGVVEEGEYAAIQAQIIDLLSNLVDPDTGKKVFQRVLPQEELSTLHLDHINSGDVFAQAYPGYHLDGWRGKEEIFEPADFYGQHGYDRTLPEMQAMFIAAGAGIMPVAEAFPAIEIVDYAPTIAALLGFSPAPSVDGSLIPYLQFVP